MGSVLGGDRWVTRGRRRGLRAPALWQQPMFLVPVLACIVACGVLWGLRGDLWWADRLYAWQGGRWVWQQHWLSAGVVHKGGKWLSQALCLLVFLSAVYARRDARWQAWQRPLWVLLASVLASVAVVSLLKHFTQVDCPWDLQRYGGGRAYLPMWLSPIAGTPVNHCFPAGHASSGYAWVALYFLFAAVRPDYRRLGLAAGLGLGALFGFTQQLRGAHFISHDVVTLTLCWLIAFLLNRRFNRASTAEAVA